jgi:hypothetical protein
MFLPNSKRLPRATIKAFISSMVAPPVIAAATSLEAENPPLLNASLQAAETVSILMLGLIN